MKHLLKHILLITFLIFSLSLFAQEIKVASFYLDASDVSANMQGTTVLDQNGDKCALIKIENTQKGFTFDVGLLGVVKTEYHTGEIWLYVPHGVKRITISHPTLGVLRDYDLGMTLKSAKTYIMKLTTENVITNIIDYTQTQIIEISVLPNNAQIAINGIVEPLNSEGKISKTLSFGTYKYRITAENYHTEEGTIEINNPNQKHKLNVSLKKAFGYLTIYNSSQYNGATLYIDDKKEGALPISKYPIKSGTHKVTIYKKLYKPYTETITISDDKSISIQPIFEPNYANVNIVAEQGSKIYVDGEYLSQGNWSGRLELGEHKIECKKENHKTTVKTIKLFSTNSVQYMCETPQPIYGTIEVSTYPANADVMIDGEDIGKTPFVKQNVLIGERELTISKPGHKTIKRTIKVEENKVSDICETLNSQSDFIINTTPQNASLYINKVYIGTTPVIVERESGEYDIRLSKSGYKDYKKRVEIDGNTPDQTIKLKRQFYEPSEFYMNFNGRIKGYSGIEIGLGGYIKNFNLEVLYQLSFDKSSDVKMLDDYSYLYDYDKYVDCRYKYQGLGLRVGYGIIMGTRVRLTPQIGTNFVLLRENEADYEYYFTEGVITTGVVSAKLSVALGKYFALEASPEYGFILGGSQKYEELSSMTDEVKQSTSGFTMKVGFNIFF